MPRGRRKTQVATRRSLRSLLKRADGPSTTNNEDSAKSQVARQRNDAYNALLQASKTELAQQDVEKESTTVIDCDSDGSSSQPFEVVKYSLSQFSDKLDPFAQLPVTLNRFQEHLVNFYLSYYPKLTYGLSTRLKPHPVAINFSIAVNNPPNFQIALARSALYRVSLQKYTTDFEKHELEIAMMKHKGEAIRMVKEMSVDDGSIDHKDNLIAAIISLGTLDTRTGSNETAKLHFMAVRRLLRSIGGPLKLKSALLSRVMVHFECLYGTAGASYIWDQDDRNHLLKDLNRYLVEVWTLWQSISRNDRDSETCKDRTRGAFIDRPGAGHIVSPPLLQRGSTSSTTGSTATSNLSSATSILAPPSSKTSMSSDLRSPRAPPRVELFALPSGSSLREALSRPLPEDENKATRQDSTKMTFQLTCLFTIAHMVLDYAHHHDRLESHMARINGIVDDAQLEGQPCNNHMWLIQVHDQSSSHSRRIWRAASFVWLLRPLPYILQKKMRDWLLAFLVGECVAGKSPKKVDTFHFSYAVRNSA